jgi:hypothetical protein
MRPTFADLSLAAVVPLIALPLVLQRQAGLRLAQQCWPGAGSHQNFDFFLLLSPDYHLAGHYCRLGSAVMPD